MNKNRKKLLIIGVAFICAVALLVGAGLIVLDNDTTDEQHATRSDWVVILGQNLGLTTYEQQSPYFSDVNAAHEAFTYLQSCKEWGIVQDTGKFHPDKPATREFVAITAVLSLGSTDESLMDMSSTELFEYATENKIMSTGSPKDEMTKEECNEIIENLKDYFLNSHRNEYSNIVLKEGVLDYSTVHSIASDGNIVYLPLDFEEEVSVGTIFIVPGRPYGEAKKAVSIYVDGETMVVETVAPDLNEVFENLEFYFIGTPAIEDIVPLQEGVTIEPLSQEEPSVQSERKPTLVSLSAVTPLASGTKKDPISFKVPINITKGKLSANATFNDYFEVEFEKEFKKFFGTKVPSEAADILEKTHTIVRYDKNGTPVLEKTEQWKGGFELVGSLKVSNLYVEVGYEDNLGSFSSKLHFEVESSLSVKGKLSGSVPIYETVIPGPWGVWVKVVFSVYVDVNGNLSLGADIEHTTNLTYENKKFKTVQQTDYESHYNLGATIASGIKGEVSPSVLGVQLFDVSAKAGASLDVDAMRHMGKNKVMICIDGKLHFPIVNVSVGSNSDTLASKLGIKGTFKLVDKSGGLAKSATKTLWHYEITGVSASNTKQCTWDTFKNSGTSNTPSPTISTKPSDSTSPTVNDGPTEGTTPGNEGTTPENESTTPPPQPEDPNSNYIMDANLSSTYIFKNTGTEESYVAALVSAGYNIRADWVILAADGTPISHANSGYICFTSDELYILQPGEVMIVAVHLDTCEDAGNLFRCGPDISAGTTEKEPITRYRLDKNKNYIVSNQNEFAQVFYFSGTINPDDFTSANTQFDFIYEDAYGEILNIDYNTYLAFLEDVPVQLEPGCCLLLRPQSDYTSKDYVVIYTLNYGEPGEIQISESDTSPVRVLELEVGHSYSISNVVNKDIVFFVAAENVDANYKVFYNGQEIASYEDTYLAFTNSEIYSLEMGKSWHITPLSSNIIIFVPYTHDNNVLAFTEITNDTP